jgi:hypothetical protein
LASGFRAVEGLKPIKLPERIGVMDLMVRINHNPGAQPAEDTRNEQIRMECLDDTNPANLIDYAYKTKTGKNKYIKNKYIVDMSSFSIVFSPSGKMVMHHARVRNKKGIYDPNNSDPEPRKHSTDDIFNSPVNIVDNKTGMFIQDDYAELGLGAELSRNRFIIYERTQFNKLNAQRRFDYLNSLELIYINPYIGTIISPD